MSSTGNRIVWVLGSGFSRHVGGPLLDELLSRKGGALAMARYQDKNEEYREVRDVFARHHKRGRRLWDNAEQFLDMLDQAREEPGLAKLILPDKDPSALKTLWQTGCLAVADECRFCDVAFTGGESWKPYQRWKRILGDRDFVITFNYDTVPETLGLKAVVPGEDPNVGRLVFKLHGSVDWSMVDGKVVRDIKRGGGVPIIATPGPTKFKECGPNGVLEPLWEEAQAVLKAADAIVFMGYRFPPTDSHALSTLLDAIFKNGSEVLRLHTVLGPRVNDEDTVRLKMLLLRTMRAKGRKPRTVAGDRDAYSIHVHPLYAQDFMATFTELELLKPPPVDEYQ